ncbi:DUF5825 family protein [Saccharothrix luteola]|uniref:DUF5825 family protein n=1 Tax=Saccharothrix luteola TaxID=2893018 RepID=UPI001E4FF980|nr:DUF5825 family protein [Saccharothrix luteola]MCC8246719.1 DUF5825 family protein [Saccharothrix luteola]
MTAAVQAFEHRPAPVPLLLWRDHDDAVLHLPELAMGEQPASGDPQATAADLYARGVRKVSVGSPVDLSGGMDARTLVWLMVFLRELTSWSVAYDWTMISGKNQDVWTRLNHFHPPRAMPDHPDADAVLEQWRSTYYLCKCIHRHGPGFLEVRDRRAGDLSRFVIDDPDYLAAVETLMPGARSDSIPPDVLAHLIDEGLVGTVDAFAWWLPYRVRRWPWPSMIV